MSKNWFAKHTLNLRHLLVKIVTPKIYESSIYIEECLPRPMIEFLHEYFGTKLLTGVEIGVSLGVHAESILKTVNIEKLFLVDPYIPYIGHTGIITKHANAFPKAKKRLSPFKDKIVFVHKTSMDALDFIPNKLDFVYIDGNHSYSFVKDDIEHYYEKVREKGVLGGHDFSSIYLSVIKAVAEFSATQNLPFDAALSDWWIIKRDRKH